MHCSGDLTPAFLGTVVAMFFVVRAPHAVPLAEQVSSTIQHLIPPSLL